MFSAERTVFELCDTLQLASCFSICTPFRTDFLLLDSFIIGGGAERTEFSCT